MTGQTFRNLIVVCGDQLDHASAALDGFDPERDAILMTEAAEEATYVWQSKRRIAVFFAAMRHFRDAQRRAGRTVLYNALDDETPPATLAVLLFMAVSVNGATSLRGALVDAWASAALTPTPSVSLLLPAGHTAYAAAKRATPGTELSLVLLSADDAEVAAAAGGSAGWTAATAAVASLAAVAGAAALGLSSAGVAAAVAPPGSGVRLPAVRLAGAAASSALRVALVRHRLQSYLDTAHAPLAAAVAPLAATPGVAAAVGAAAAAVVGVGA